MTRFTRLSIATWFLVVTSLPPLTASGQSPQQAPPPEPTPSLQDLKRQANDAMASLRPAEALAAYRRAYEISGEPALLYNIGHALEALEDYPGALAAYTEFQIKAAPELKARVPRLDDLIVETRMKVAAVSVRSNVVGARVLLRDKALGVIPASGQLDVSVNAGPGHLEVVADGYSPFVREVQLTGGGTTTMLAELIATDRAGVLVVTTTPAGGEVTVDDQDLGAAPVEASLVAGMHTVRVSRAGFQPTTSTVVVAAHERKDLSLSLENVPPVFARWWFWTGVAVAIAGGVAIGYAALTERSPDKGTISPGLDRVLAVRF